MHDDFYVIATGNPSRFHGRLELPMSLQTRFTTVLLQPIQPDELMLIIKDKAPDMPDDEAWRWCGAFDVAKRTTPTLTTRALWEALKGTSGCPDGASEIKPQMSDITGIGASILPSPAGGFDISTLSAARPAPPTRPAPPAPRPTIGGV